MAELSAAWAYPFEAFKLDLDFVGAIEQRGEGVAAAVVGDGRADFPLCPRW